MPESVETATLTPSRPSLAEFLLGLLSDQDVDWLTVVGARQILQAGDVLIHAGTEPRGLFIVLDGRLVVYDAEQHPVDAIQRGELAGEVSFVDRLSATATVVAEEETLLFTIERTQLLLKVDRDAGFAARFYRALAAVLATRFRFALSRASAVADSTQQLPVGVNPHLAAARFQRLLARLARTPGHDCPERQRSDGVRRRARRRPNSRRSVSARSRANAWPARGRLSSAPRWTAATRVRTQSPALVH